MAVTQISKIQIRRGFQADIGNLAAGEFAWAIDSQRLFIGNGTTEEGAPIGGITEIMTNQSTTNVNDIIVNYVYKGILGGYEVVTGIDSTTPVIRTLQDKVDDFVNVRDFGATGNGNIDDTLAIQRAIYELYDRFEPEPRVKTRRRLRLNAGKYLIEGELKLPPFLSIEGEGIENVELILKNTVRFVTSTGDDSAEVVSPTIYPRSLHISGLTIRSAMDITLLKIDGAEESVFDRVAFVGEKIEPNNNTIDNKGVWLSSNVEPTKKIVFNNCVFRNLVYGVDIDSIFGTTNIEFNNCVFRELANGIVTHYTESPEVPVSDIRIYATLFEDLYDTAVYGADGVRGILSIGCTYKNVASFYEGDETAASIWRPVLEFRDHGNYSIADTFYRALEVSNNFPRIRDNGYRVITASIDQWFSLGSARQIAGDKRILIRNESFFIQLDKFVYRGLIDYTMTRGNHYRSGTLKFVFNSSSREIVHDNDYVETDDVGVTLNVTSEPDDTFLTLSGVVDNSVNENVAFSFDVKTFS